MTFPVIRKRDGILLVTGGFFLWLIFEMAFYGEPLFHYATSQRGYGLYFFELCFVCAALVCISFLPRSVFRILWKPRVLVALGLAGSVCLVVVLLSTLPNAQIPSLAAPICACAAFSLCVLVLMAFWFNRMILLVFEYGLREVSFMMLVGVALSFLLLPRTLRSAPYGLALTISSCLVLGVVCALFARDGRVRAHAEFTAKAGCGRRQVVLSLCSLAVISFLVYLLSYTEFVSGGFSPVVNENPYAYLAFFGFMATLLAILAFLDVRRLLSDNVFLFLLVGLMLLTFLVYFGVLASVVSQGDYVYALSKLLRRIVKVYMLFILVVMAYQNALDPIRSFLLALVLPLSLGKLTQMILAEAVRFEVFSLADSLYYLSAIGFLVIACWTLFLLFYIQGGVIFFARQDEGAEDDSPTGGRASEFERDSLSEAFSAFGLTDREEEVVSLLARGYSLKRISGMLCISQNTVKTHTSSVYQKLDVHSKQEIIDMAQAARVEGRSESSSVPRPMA